MNDRHTQDSMSVQVATPLGDMLLVARGHAIVYAQFIDRHVLPVPGEAVRDPRHPVLVRARIALERYFADGAGVFDVALAPGGTPFQRRVWDAIARIPRGGTTTYALLAATIGAPRAVRAVGAATGRNPLCLLIPCHRVVGAGGALTGYAGGLERKRALLALESSERTLPVAA